jgi:uncharacterized membrane protein YkvI
MRNNFNNDGAILVGLFLGYLIIAFAFSLINTAVLRFATEIVVKRMPSFKTASWISVICSIVLFTGIFVVTLIIFRAGGSILAGGSSFVLDNSRWLEFMPVSFFLLSSWILNSKYLTDAQSRVIGFGKGLAVIAVQSAFLIIVGLLIFIVSVIKKQYY